MMWPYNMGGPISEEEKRKRELMASRAKIAKSHASATPVQPKGPLQGGGSGSPTLLQQAGGMATQMALKSLLGPLGDLFNMGGKVDNKHHVMPNKSWMTGATHRNMGGPISKNPYGYNEGGNVDGTPIKKVMDMDKLDAQRSMENLKEEQAERSFLKAEARKDEMHQLQMKQKEESHEQAMKLKEKSATMKGPLSGGK